MTKMFRVNKYHSLPKYALQEIEVDRFTNKSVWINDHRTNRFTSYFSYFETSEEALELLNSCAANQVRIAQNRLEAAINFQDWVNSLRDN